MCIRFFVNEKLGFILLLTLSFIASSWLALPLSIHSVKEGKVPEVFNVLIYSAPNTISMKRFNELEGLSSTDVFLLPKEKVCLLNQELARQYTGYGGTWSFEILAQETNKQYIHVIASGDDDIIESWYWATNTQITPIKHRWLNPGVIFIVLPLTIFFTSLGIFFYCFISRRTNVAAEAKTSSLTFVGFPPR